MESEKISQNLHPLDIVIFHVGGVGGYGPVDKIIERFPKQSVVVCFEANLLEDDKNVQQEYQKDGVRTILVGKCLGDTEGKQKFYINKNSESSSLLPPAQGALSEHVRYKSLSRKNIITWADNCQVDRVVEIETTTIDRLREKELPFVPDIFSIDAQGAELRIMKGGIKTLGHVLAVVTEVDYMEIYQGQNLAFEQQAFLAQEGFRLVDVINNQYWHPYMASGSGFLTVGEAIFFRDLQKYSDKFQGDKKALLYKLAKLSMIAYAFERFSYSAKIVTFALEKYGQEAQNLFSQHESLKPIFAMQQYMARHEAEYIKNPKMFYRSGFYVNLIENIKSSVPENLRSQWRNIKKNVKKYGERSFRKF